MKNYKRLYLFTGKGGVGKSTVSLAFTRYLREQGINAHWVSFEKTSFDQQTGSGQHADWDVPKIFLNIEEGAEGYIEQKLGSSLIAKLVTKTPFFRALVNMIPGFSYVILLGKMLDMIQKSSPPMTLVLDAPASGHALAMLEATSNFRDIFQAGLLYEDTTKMLRLMNQPDFLKVIILSLPTELSLHEALELQSAISKLGTMETTIALNYSLQKWKSEIASAPQPLQEKLKLELDLLEKQSTHFSTTFPYSSSEQSDKLYKDILSSLEKLS